MAKTQGGDGQQFSTFSFRPPLPGAKIFPGVPKRKLEATTDAHESKKGKAGMNEGQPIDHQSPDEICAKSTSPPISFLFRMYVACHILRLATETRFTALVLIHRYVQAKQNPPIPRITAEQENWPWVGAVCLFLACKAEDESRRLRDVINMAQMVLSSSDTNENGEDQYGDGRQGIKKTKKVNCDRTITIDMDHPPPLDKTYWDNKKKTIQMEQMVLKWLGFDCSVSHPHRAVFLILEKMMIEKGLDHPKQIHMNGLKDKLLSISYRRLNDALFHPPALRCGVVELACAAIDLAVEDALKEESNNVVTDETITTSEGTSIGAPLVKEKKLTPRTAEISSLNTRHIFKDEWWKSYDVLKKDFDNCKNHLERATYCLRTIATVTTDDSLCGSPSSSRRCSRKVESKPEVLFNK